MDSIAVTKPDMAVTKRDRLGLSLFGLLSLAFGDEVRTRSAWQTGLYREVPLELLEEDEPVPISGSERELHLDVDLKVVLENLKQEHKQADKRQKQAAERILERVYLLERRISEAAPAGTHINVRIDPLQAGQAAAPNGQTANMSAAAKKNGATSEAQAVREKEILSVIRTAVAEKDAQQRLQAAQMEEKEQAGRAASIARVMHRRQIGTQAAAAVRQARRAADGSLWRTVKQEQPGRLSAPLTPVSWSTAAPAGEGWTPRWQEEHPGFAPKNEPGGGQAAGGSILLPDQLRLRRQRALQQAAEAAAEPFVADMRTADGSLVHPDNAIPEAAGIRQDETVRLLVQRLDRAVEQAVRRPVRRQTADTASGASPVQQESPAEDARMAQPSGKTDSMRPARGRTAPAARKAQAEKQAAAAHGEPDAASWPQEERDDAAVSGSTANRTETAAARAERPGTADQNERPAQRAQGGTDTAMQAVPSGADAPQTGLPQEALLHRADGQDSVQHVGKLDGRASVQGRDDPAARKAQEGKQTAKIHMQPDDASRQGEQPVSGTSGAGAERTEARMEQHGAAMQTAQTEQYERETIGTERQAALPGAAAPQAALPPEALLYRAEMQDSSPAAQRGTSSAPGQERSDNRKLPKRDKPRRADTAYPAGIRVGAAQQTAAAPEAGTAPSLMTAGQSAQKPSGTDRQEQETGAVPQAKTVPRAYAAPNEQPPLPAAPLIHRETASDDMEPNNLPGRPASIQKEERFTHLPEQAQPHLESAAGRRTDTRLAGAAGRTVDTSSAQQPAGADAAVMTDSHTAERPMHTAVLPQKSGEAQTAFDHALPVKTAGAEGYAASEPLTWRTDAEPSAPQAQHTETAGKAQNAAAAPADTAYAEGKQQTTAVLSHKGRTDEIEYSTAHPSRSITGKPLSGHGPAPGNAGGAAQADAGLVYRTDTAQERQNGLPVQAKAIVTAAAGHGQPSDRLRTALRRSTEEILARPMKPVQTTLVRPQQAGNTAAVRPMETFTDAALQPGETASRRAAVMDGNELSYLPLQPAEQKTDQKASSQTSALPDWAQRFLQQPAGADRQNTQRFSAVQQQPAAVPPGQIEWTAPGAVPKAAPIVFRENKQPEAQHPAAPARLSDSELRRAADKVYRMIEDRLRRELRRSGK